MFGNLVYFNRNKIEQYAMLMQGNNKDILTSLTSDDNDITDSLLACSKFEELLKGRDDYYDFVDTNPDVTINDVKNSSIIKVKGEIYIPEKFDMIHLIDEYKELLFDAINPQNDVEKDLLKMVLNSSNSKMKIPIYCELNGQCDYWMGICKASHGNLMIEYNDIEDYEGIEFSILAKLEAKKYYKDTPLIVYDIYKDFLGLNRAIRKSISSDKKESFENISVEEDYLALELLAIY
ncbi:hypothetical protein [Ruminococcus sp. HUN007]|uniref:DUF6414 family protein n=1 Tax=Ruminococcus sp. HUN007 TaxID=1514668 RepID=UPI0005D2730F|nr:hypothetical protein [Ruminococcus sp. HUN007]